MSLWVPVYYTYKKTYLLLILLSNDCKLLFVDLVESSLTDRRNIRFILAYLIDISSKYIFVKNVISKNYVIIFKINNYFVYTVPLRSSVKF